MRPTCPGPHKTCTVRRGLLPVSWTRGCAGGEQGSARHRGRRSRGSCARSSSTLRTCAQRRVVQHEGAHRLRAAPADHRAFPAHARQQGSTGATDLFRHGPDPPATFAQRLSCFRRSGRRAPGPSLGSIGRARAGSNSVFTASGFGQAFGPATVCWSGKRRSWDRGCWRSTRRGRSRRSRWMTRASSCRAASCLAEPTGCASPPNAQGGPPEHLLRADAFAGLLRNRPSARLLDAVLEPSHVHPDDRRGYREIVFRMRNPVLGYQAFSVRERRPA